MHLEPESFDLARLADRAGVSTRTVRYYIQQGLLPAPETRGPGAHYSEEHLDRLRLIRRLQREHLPLGEIRRRIEALSAAQVRSLVDSEPEPPSRNASQYIRDALSGGKAIMASPRDEPFLLRSLAAPPPNFSKRSSQPTRSQWERLILSPDIELHVRRPLTREQNRQVERLVEAARIIFDEEP